MKFLTQLKIQKNNNGVSTGLVWPKAKGEKLQSFSPVDGKLIASVIGADKNNYDAVITKAQQAFSEWRLWPAPKRGEIVRQVGRRTTQTKIAAWPTGFLRNGQELTGRLRRKCRK